MSEERVTVRIVLTVGDEAAVQADTSDATEPVHYPAAEIAAAVGVDVDRLPGMRLTAAVDAQDRLSDWRRA